MRQPLAARYALVAAACCSLRLVLASARAVHVHEFTDADDSKFSERNHEYWPAGAGVGVTSGTITVSVLSSVGGPTLPQQCSAAPLSSATG